MYLFPSPPLSSLTHTLLAVYLPRGHRRRGISSLRPPAFSEFGVDAMHALQLVQLSLCLPVSLLLSKCETKIIASRVADFDPPLPMPTPPRLHPPPPPPTPQSIPPPAPPGPTLPAYPTYVPPPSASSHSRSLVPPHPQQHLRQVKTEHPTPANGGTELGSGMGLSYNQSAHGQQLPGPALNALALSFPSASSPPNRAHSSSLFTLPGATATPMSFSATALYRMPQTDGPAPSYNDGVDSDEDEDDLEPVQMQLPWTAHPSLSVPAPAPGAAKMAMEWQEDDLAINSDLDDSDDEDNDAADAADEEGAIVFAARVKNKWKCVLKDGMIHTGGRDYLFQRCAGHHASHPTNTKAKELYSTQKHRSASRTTSSFTYVYIQTTCAYPYPHPQPTWLATSIVSLSNRIRRQTPWMGLLLVVLNLPRRTKNMTDLTTTPGTHSNADKWLDYTSAWEGRGLWCGGAGRIFGFFWWECAPAEIPVIAVELLRKLKERLTSGALVQTAFNSRGEILHLAVRAEG
ncbi:transcription factor IIA, alpha/beta subunit-domain-containing protein [Mycena albidolilacea]|uniref:Transcription factor IIA, alpha/beta subunit-domain-containing protein n=1 Tax=Mycena albidolilacea TaxID=1033008 RepID=A0AAD7AP88_9AGAR|nr:transcription factor IIA, alpha/beta subunit-domain-containing protein [Mycena albidolilacea]